MRKVISVVVPSIAAFWKKSKSHDGADASPSKNARFAAIAFSSHRYHRLAWYHDCHPGLHTTQVHVVEFCAGAGYVALPLAALYPTTVAVTLLDMKEQSLVIARNRLRAARLTNVAIRKERLEVTSNGGGGERESCASCDMFDDELTTRWANMHGMSIERRD